MSWQGQPAVIRSTGGTAAQSRAVMSPRLGGPGQRAARTAAACGSVSAYQAISASRTAVTPMSRPPYPVHRLPARRRPGDEAAGDVAAVTRLAADPGQRTAREVRAGPA